MVYNMDSKYKVGKEFSPCPEPPSFYFARQCYISVDPDEKTTRATVELLGEDRFVWASDFPHIDTKDGPVAELKKNLRGLPQRAQRKILGENTTSIYCYQREISSDLGPLVLRRPPLVALQKRFSKGSRIPRANG